MDFDASSSSFTYRHWKLRENQGDKIYVTDPQLRLNSDGAPTLYFGVSTVIGTQAVYHCIQEWDDSTTESPERGIEPGFCTVDSENSASGFNFVTEAIGSSPYSTSYKKSLLILKKSTSDGSNIADGKWWINFECGTGINQIRFTRPGTTHSGYLVIIMHQTSDTDHYILWQKETDKTISMSKVVYT